VTAPAPAPGIANVVVGTAGHIDHGKSSLVRTLTGIDPDRLPEEQERGMTIDLGFARFRGADGRTVGIIDVPGHERFVKNMAAGATSLDIVMLVVAADDGVMPQTREHLEILGLLGVQSGFVVLTKVDLVDPELRKMAIDDVKALVRGTFLDGQPVVPVSNATGEGIPELKAELDRRVAAATPRSSEGLFRMPIQRVFSARGHGTVVTGVPLSGAVGLGHELEILPLGKRGRIRGIHAYGEARERASAGHSCALNLSDVDYREIRRGMVVGEPGSFQAATLFEARMRHLAGREQPLEHRTPVRVHVGTSELLGRVSILDKPRLLPGEEGLVQLELEEPVVACAGDRFLARQVSPMVTLGGGVLFGAARTHRRRLKDHHIEALHEREKALGDPVAALAFAAEQRRFEPFDARELASDVALPLSEAQELVATLVAKGELVDAGRGRLLSKRFTEQAEEAVKSTLKQMHKAAPLKKLLEIRALRTQVATLPESTLQLVRERLAKRGVIVEEGAPGSLRLASHKPAVSGDDERLLESLRKLFGDAGLQPPTAEEAAAKVGALPKKVAAMLELLADEGAVARVGALRFAREAMDKAKTELVRVARAHKGEVVIPELRDALQTSRKYMIPLLEHFDGTGLTARSGDKRFLRESRLEKQG
jgi:selenocysteine-specific elongation factor